MCVFRKHSYLNCLQCDWRDFHPIRIDDFAAIVFFGVVRSRDDNASGLLFERFRCLKIAANNALTLPETVDRRAAKAPTRYITISRVSALHQTNQGKMKFIQPVNPRQYFICPGLGPDEMADLARNPAVPYECCRAGVSFWLWGPPSKISLARSSILKFEGDRNNLVRKLP